MSWVDLDCFVINYPWGKGVVGDAASWRLFEDSLHDAILEAKKRGIDPLSAIDIRYETPDSSDVFEGTLGEYLEELEESLEEYLEWLSS